MPIPTYSVGQVLGASDCNNWFVPLAAVALTDQSTSSLTFINDNTLSVPVAASANYAVELFIRCNGPNTAGIAFDFTGPSGATLSCTYVNAAATADINLGQAFGIGTLVSTGTDEAFALIGSLVTLSTAGTLQVQFALTGTGTVTRRARSRLTLQRIG
jgi:hypothetical protein